MIKWVFSKHWNKQLNVSAKFIIFECEEVLVWLTAQSLSELRGPAKEPFNIFFIIFTIVKDLLSQ